MKHLLLGWYPIVIRLVIENDMYQSFRSTSQLMFMEVAKMQSKTRVSCFHALNSLIKNVGTRSIKSIRQRIHFQKETSAGNNAVKYLNTFVFIKFLFDFQFYLSFENSICDDYITEKFWKVMERKNAVPVTLLISFNFTIISIV